MKGRKRTQQKLKPLIFVNIIIICIFTWAQLLSVALRFTFGGNGDVVVLAIFRLVLVFLPIFLIIVMLFLYICLAGGDGGEMEPLKPLSNANQDK